MVVLMAVELLVELLNIKPVNLLLVELRTPRTELTPLLTPVVNCSNVFEVPRANRRW